MHRRSSFSAHGPFDSSHPGSIAISSKGRDDNFLPVKATDCSFRWAHVSFYANPLSTFLQRFACARLSQPCLSESCSDFSATSTTIAFDNSSLRWLEINA
jgi:hypothetical protein